MKGDKAVHKIIEDNIKPSETVTQAIERLNGNMDEANNMFSEFMGNYGHLQVDMPINDIRKTLSDRVRDNAGLGGEADKQMAKQFLKMLDDDLAKLAEKKLMKERGLNYEQTDRILRWNNGKGEKGPYKKEMVNKVLGNRLTLADLDGLKKRMWEKTGLFRRNAMSMKNAGEKNMASHRGGYAIMDEINNLNENEQAILEKIGGLIDGEINELGNKYLAGLEKQGIASGKLSNIYMRLNKERSKLIGTLKILNSANDALSRHGLDYMPIYPKTEWERLAEEAAQRELNIQMPISETAETAETAGNAAIDLYDRSKKYINQAIIQQGGGHGGKFAGENLRGYQKTKQ